MIIQAGSGLAGGRKLNEISVIMVLVIVFLRKWALNRGPLDALYNYAIDNRDL
ncbi:MAG: hypothetical protein ABSB78_10015 [Bacteroidota bacterium]